MKYRRARRIGHSRGGEWGFRDALRAVARDGEGRWLLVGDEQVVVFTSDGEPVRRWATERPGWAAAVDAEGRIWVGEEGRIEVFSPRGRLEDGWQDELFARVTALAVTGDEIFAADVGSRWIHRFDRDRRLLNHLGDRHRKGGFHLPNGVLDFALDVDGTVVVANPGMHRVERYAPDGDLLDRFGAFGQHDPAAFPGCCNPTNLALGPASEVVVSEKAGPRVKVYDRAGGLLAIVAAGADFDPDCKNMDLAVDASGSIGVVDTVGRQVVVFDRVAGPEPAAARGAPG
ncbi:MAG: NHL repeat-containing protein [Acidobacteriota bacterium]|nr:NHL repeat-containing protein [Acidobacteriota bacterium]MDH3524241.1 NHL repeat-containing protein [Acidobacteriota bacterium]